MTRRRNRQPASLDEVIDRLPDRFLGIELVVDGQMTGLRAYMAELGDYLCVSLGHHVEQCVTVDVMAELGIPPAEWYRLAFQQDTQRKQLA